MGCRQKDKDNAKKEMKDIAISKTSRGGFMAKGKCTDCGCGMCRIMSKDNAEKAVADGEAKKAY
ncbi:hypothetical protein HOD29_04865 [archaeon]|nr:hypothetical protein [archaeon]